MKQLMRMTVFGLLMTGCSWLTTTWQQLQQAELVMEVSPDSAWILLEQIPASQLTSEREQAVYHLLTAQAKYKLYQPIPSSDDLNQSIRYFDKSGDYRHLAMAYYYKGVVDYDLELREEAVVSLKKAEELAEGTGEELLNNKIYEELHHVNLHAENFQLALSYAKRFLQSSIVLGDSQLICRAYDDIALDFSRLDLPDSTRLYREKCLSLMRQMNTQNPYFFANYANDLIEAGHDEEAQEWLDKAKRIKPMANQYIMSGIIAENKGDTLQARKDWEKAVEFGDSRFTIKAYRLLSNLYDNRGDLQRAYNLHCLADSVKDDYNEQIRSAQLAESQQKYDKAVAERAMMRKLNVWLTVLILALVGIMIMVLLLRHYRRKVEEYKNTIDDNLRQAEELHQKISLLQSTGQDFEKEVSVLKSQINQLKESTALKLGRGKEVYDIIEQDGKLVNFTVEQEEDFIDFFAFTYSARFMALMQPYHSLTLRQKTYLILREMGKSDKDIQTLLNITDSTIRSYRHRLGHKK